MKAAMVIAWALALGWGLWNVATSHTMVGAVWVTAAVVLWWGSTRTSGWF